MFKFSYEFIIKNIIDLTQYEYTRNIVIIPQMIGKEYDVLNGKNKFKILINSKMLGFKLGEFIFNRKVGDIHDKSKKKKILNKKKK